MDKPWHKHYGKLRKEIEIPSHLTLAGMLEESCHRYSHRDALICMGHSLTFEQFNRRAENFASYLVNVAKVEKGDRVAIVLPNVMQFPIAFFGLLKVGCVAVNTNPLYTPRELKHQLKDSGAKVVVILNLFTKTLEEIVKDTEVKTIVTTSIGDGLAPLKGFAINMVMKLKGMVPDHSMQVTSFVDAMNEGTKHDWNPPAISPDDLAMLQYTGGTTGVAKGAMLTHRNLVANSFQLAEWMGTALVPGRETVLTALPIYHVFALSVNFLALIRSGTTVVLVPKPIPIDNLVKVFKKQKITVFTGVNALFIALNNSESFKKLAPRDLKCVVAGGTALQPHVADEFQAITGVSMIEGYGLTEASPVTHASPLDYKGPVGTIGVPVPSTDARIVDPDGKDVPVGETGELIVAGPQVMKGYWKKPEETAKVIKDGWLYTGDMARVDETGFFYIVDRKKDMVIVSGFNVYPKEVEEILASHDKVLEAAVIGVPDENKGEAVKAFIIAKSDLLDEKELRGFCEKNLTNYKRPSYYEFVETLPKTPVGKVLKKDLRTQASS